MKYKELKNYKYQLVEDYVLKIDIQPIKDIFVPYEHKFYIQFTKKGILYIYHGYSWDGPSGPTVDTKNFIRGSLVHDALYQLIRQGKLAIEHRDYADRLLQKICKEDGMSSFRANNVYYAVKLFGESSASPTNQKESQDVILEAP